jgi:hypothetical protein
LLLRHIWLISAPPFAISLLHFHIFAAFFQLAFIASLRILFRWFSLPPFFRLFS